jgi:DNA ligase (NAD+)
MLSLDNTFSGAEVVKFLGKGEEVHIEPKIDGCSLELIYEKGKLVSAATRGDGTSGDDVTANVRTILTVPLELTKPIDLRVRGEVYMTFTVFNKLNQELVSTGEDQLANPRNAAAGAIKLKDPYEVSKRQLSFVAYSLAGRNQGHQNTGRTRRALADARVHFDHVPAHDPGHGTAGV